MTVRFGDFLLDSDARQLSRAGRDIRLSPKAFDLLCALLARRPDVLSKNDLLAAIWPDTFVVEANLNVVIGEIRKALGDDRQAPRFIRTVHGVGYAFCAQAIDVADGETAAAGSRGRIARSRCLPATTSSAVIRAARCGSTMKACHGATR